MLTAHIEIPKGGDRRTYLRYDKSGFIDLGPIKNVIPINDGIMPINYGFIVGLINTKEEGEQPEELDVLVYSDESFKQGALVSIEPIALFEREDHDDKIIARVLGSDITWNAIAPSEQKLLLDYFGYKSPIVRVGDREAAESLIQSLKN